LDPTSATTASVGPHRDDVFAHVDQIIALVLEPFESLVPIAKPGPKFLMANAYAGLEQLSVRVATRVPFDV
jgi:hypothetical protein